MVNWAEFPPELLQLVTQRLSLDDYVRFAAVCTSWRSVATRENYNPKTRLPWLLVDLIDSTEFIPFPGLEKGNCKLPSARGYFLPCSSQGWIARPLIHCELVLFNPVSRATIKVPTLEEFRGRTLCMKQFAMSASPSQSTNYSVMIYFYDVFDHMWMWRSQQRVWMMVRVPPTSHIIQLIHYKGKFVALDDEFQILTLDDDDDVIEGSFRVRLQVFVDGHSLHLVECSGLLLAVYRKWAYFQVIEVDLEGRNWREVKSLGNASLFLNKHFCSSSFSMEFNDETTSDQGLMMVKPNCIYFEAFHLQPKRRFYLDIYHMDSGDVERKFEGKWMKHAWIQPCF